MRDRPRPETVHAWRMFLQAHAQITARMDDELNREAGLSLAWYDVLLALSEAPEGRLRMRDLAQRVLITRSNCTRLVDRMLAAGLVARDPDPQDGRGVIALLTDSGRVALRRAAVIHLRGIRAHFEEPLDQTAIASLGDTLLRVVQEGSVPRP